jgi:isopentenyldiphosphate isomerase
MEQFDILDRSGKATGKTADKDSKLNDGEYALGIHAYIYNSSYEFLIQQRSFIKTLRPGCWDIHMGHVIAGETSKEAVIREINEEIGIAFSESDIDFIDRFFWEEYRHLADIYFIHADIRKEELTMQKDEVIDVKFVSKNDMIKIISEMDYRPEAYKNIIINKINTLK